MRIRKSIVVWLLLLLLYCCSVPCLAANTLVNELQVTLTSIQRENGSIVAKGMITNKGSHILGDVLINVSFYDKDQQEINKEENLLATQGRLKPGEQHGFTITTEDVATIEGLTVTLADCTEYEKDEYTEYTFHEIKFSVLSEYRYEKNENGSIYFYPNEVIPLRCLVIGKEEHEYFPVEIISSSPNLKKKFEKQFKEETSFKEFKDPIITMNNDYIVVEGYYESLEDDDLSMSCYASIVFSDNNRYFIAYYDLFGEKDTIKTDFENVIKDIGLQVFANPDTDLTNIPVTPSDSDSSVSKSSDSISGFASSLPDVASGMSDSISGFSSDPGTASGSTQISGVRPEVKSAIDAYEEFFDDYIEFMTTSTESGNTLTMLSEYLEYLSKYSQKMEEFEKLDEIEDFTDAEMAYYLQVSLRIEGKLLGVVGSFSM